MCGITGVLSNAPGDHSALVKEMCDRLHHRGPDDFGLWIDAAAGLGLGHRRLSIVDLSQSGHQPMVSSCGRYVLTYNGEIYNFKAIKDQLKGPADGYRGRSDTEVFLQAISELGVGPAIALTNGMFALGIWDRLTRTLTIARDRVGEKPLYYGWAGRDFVFASEIKAMRCHPSMNREVDRGALALFLRTAYIPSPYSIYKDICKLPPGTALEVQFLPSGPKTREFCYWSLSEVVRRGEQFKSDCTLQESIGALEKLIVDAVQLRMVSDVPIGAFLSGGVDSSALVSIMQSLSSRPVKTYTIGFWDKAFDESQDAALVAGHLRTDHTLFHVSPEEAMRVIPMLPSIYDEPYADPSQIPTYLVSKLARQSVTVSLSGDGGDELFGGYNRYTWGPRLWSLSRLVPEKLRAILGNILSRIPARRWERVSGAIPQKFRPRHMSDQIYKIVNLLKVNDTHEFYLNLVSHWRNPKEIVIGAEARSTLLDSPKDWPELDSFLKQMMFLDLGTYLPDDILAKLDRASMAVGLEARVPFLDHRIVEFAWRLPPEAKIQGSVGKWILRQILYKYVPKDIIERPKTGFSIPLANWLRGPLREWAEDMLNPLTLRSQGYLQSDQIRQRWSEHLDGIRNWQDSLWNVLIFQSWLQGQN